MICFVLHDYDYFFTILVLLRSLHCKRASNARNAPQVDLDVPLQLHLVESIQIRPALIWVGVVTGFPSFPQCCACFPQRTTHAVFWIVLHTQKQLSCMSFWSIGVFACFRAKLHYFSAGVKTRADPTRELVKPIWGSTPMNTQLLTGSRAHCLERSPRSESQARRACSRRTDGWASRKEHSSPHRVW